MRRRSVHLSAVADRVGGELRGDGSCTLSDVTHDSRRVQPGSLFVAIRGAAFDGHAYVDEAAGRGASGAVVEHYAPLSLPQVRVPDTRRALGPAAALVHGDPACDLDVVGVTGTNGKTTITLMLDSIARAAARPFGRVGTLGASMPGGRQPLQHTTPEASDLQRLLRRMSDVHVSLVAMEVSSHALALHRVDGMPFAVAAFTNLSQDHLDFHAGMDEYFAAKCRLFDGRAAVHVIDVTDPPGRHLAESTTGSVVTVGFGAGHDVSITDAETDLTGVRFTCRLEGDEVRVRTRPGGAHNVRNAAVAAACARQVGIGLGEVVEGLGSIRHIRGRLEPVDLGQPFEVLVDYAHTPGAVEAVIEAALQRGEGSVIVVLGAAGDRDPGKRPLLGAAAARAHLAVITSDNPRSEDPDRLVDAVAGGTARGRARVIRQVDRAMAIRFALDEAGPGDTVLILGKGHERQQELGGRVVPFDDRAVAASHLRARWRS